MHHNEAACFYDKNYPNSSLNPEFKLQDERCLTGMISTLS